MSKGLEELKRLKNYKELTTVANIGGYERVHCKLAYNDELKPSFKTIEKELKALEIIKQKRVWANALFEMSLTTYNRFCNCAWNIPDLTQEEYDLLKEVLL